MPRPCHCRRISTLPEIRGFAPYRRTCPEILHEDECVQLGLDCMEALRLADYEKLDMDAAAMRMGISRHTFGRVLRKARQLIATALCEGRPIKLTGGPCALTSDNNEKGEEIMNEAILVAVPSEAPGGLDAAPSAHFGHCAAYTIAKMEQGKIGDVSVEENHGHEHGGCVQPVRELAAKGVTVLLAGGMGMRPLNAMQEAGIKVYYSVGQPTVKAALEAFASGKLQAFGTDQLCKGNCGHHGPHA